MKSRPLTWLLVVLALAVWGVIGWKLFSGPKEAGLPSAGTPPATRAVVAVDTLCLDFRDPFLPGEEPPVEKSADDRIGPAPVPQPERGQKPKAAVSCLGRIRKGETDYFLLSSDSETCLLRKGETAGDLTLQHVWPDSLRVVRGDDEFIVKYH